MHARASCIASTNLNPRRIDSLIIHEIGLGVNSPLCRERRTVVQARLSFIINTARTTLVLPKSIVQSASVLATGAGGGALIVTVVVAEAVCPMSSTTLHVTAISPGGDDLSRGRAA